MFVDVFVVTKHEEYIVSGGLRKKKEIGLIKEDEGDETVKTQKNATLSC